jgi:hypothetical protein
MWQKGKSMEYFHDWQHVGILVDCPVLMIFLPSGRSRFLSLQNHLLTACDMWWFFQIDTQHNSWDIFDYVKQIPIRRIRN